MHLYFVEYLMDFPQHAGERAHQLPRPTDKLSKSVTSSLQLCKFSRPNKLFLLRLNACSQRRFWVALDAILISCTSSRFTCSSRFLLHNVQPNYKHEDIYHCRHNGWHSSHWLSRYAPSISKALQLDSFAIALN